MNKTLDQLFLFQTTAAAEKGFVATLRTNPDHPIYQAHFPGNPITPGACMLHTARTLFEQWTGRPVFLKSAKNIKYLSLLIPEKGREVQFRFTLLADSETESKTQVLIADENTIYTKMTLVFSYERI